MFDIPPYPVLSIPFLLEYSTMIFESIQKKYNIDCQLIAVPIPNNSYFQTSPSISPSTSSTTTTTTTNYSSPSSPEKKDHQRRNSGSSPSSSQRCQCSLCGKKFSRQWLLQGHLRTHTGEKPFKCEICFKSFADKSNLRAHIQTHSGEKPHKCSKCGKRFALKSYLSKHEESKCIRFNNWSLNHN